MKNSSILLAIGKDAALDDLGKTLETIRAIPAQVAILIVAAIPEYPYYALGVPAYSTAGFPEEWQRDISTITTLLKEKAAAVEALLEQHDVAGDVDILSSEPALIADAIARRAMLCDMALIGDDLRKPASLFRQVAYGILFQSPIGIMLNSRNAQPLGAPKRVFVAWNTHLHSARAVHQALPLLRNAEEVIIATIDPVMTEYRDGEDPGVDVAKWLTHHGCTVSVQQYPSGGQEIGDCILAKATECGADLIVMGSYGHSRTREAIFGGTTQTLIEQTDQAVFLAH